MEDSQNHHAGALGCNIFQLASLACSLAKKAVLSVKLDDGEFVEFIVSVDWQCTDKLFVSGCWLV